jgi:hypothetical protein
VARALELIRREVDRIDVFIAVSDYYCDFMTGYLGIPADKIRTVRLGIDPDGFEARPARTVPPYTIGYLRASRRRRACTCWSKPTGGAAPDAADAAARRRLSARRASRVPAPTSRAG